MLTHDCFKELGATGLKQVSSCQAKSLSPSVSLGEFGPFLCTDTPSFLGQEASVHGVVWVHPPVIRLATSPGQCQPPVNTKLRRKW